MVASKLLLAIATIGLALPIQAAPIVFDFEDGLQGWTASGFWRREKVDVLGGEFAIFGIDGARLTMELDLTPFQAMSFDQFFTGSDPRSRLFVRVTLRKPEGGLGSIFLAAGESLLATESNPSPNPDTRWFDLSAVTGVRLIEIGWPRRACSPEDPLACVGTNFPGYVDNIRLFAAPEPTSLALLGLGIVGLAALHRRQTG